MTDVDRCVCCGEPVPEGTWVCPSCARKALGKISPCKDCNDRYVGCHAECEDYQMWSKLRNEGTKLQYLNRRAAREIRDSTTRNKLRLRKKMRHRK